MNTLYGGRDGKGRDGPVDAANVLGGILLVSPGAVGSGGRGATAKQCKT